MIKKINCSSVLLNTSHSACNLSFIFDEHLRFSDQISSLSCPAVLIFMNSVASVLVVILILQVPSLPLLSTQTWLLLLSVLKSSKVSNKSPLYQELYQAQWYTLLNVPYHSIWKSFHWLEINERIKHKLLSLTYKVLTTSQPDYLHNLISVQSTCKTHSSYAINRARPSLSSSLQITIRSFTYASPYLWNQLPSSFRQPYSVQSSPGSPHPAHAPHYCLSLRSHHLLRLSLQAQNPSVLQIFSPTLCWIFQDFTFIFSDHEWQTRLTPNSVSYWVYSTTVKRYYCTVSNKLAKHLSFATDKNWLTQTSKFLGRPRW